MKTLTPEQQRQNGAAMIANADGKPIEFSDIDNDFKWETCLRPQWKFEQFLYRPKREPVTRQWSKPSDVPGPVCWLRCKQFAQSWQFQILMVNDSWIAGIATDFEKLKGIPWRQLCEYEYSTDRKTWHPCTATED